MGVNFRGAETMSVDEEKKTENVKEEAAVVAMTAAEVEEVEGILGYAFGRRALVEEALTHPSFYYPRHGVSYERLEFVGDAVLNCLVAREVFVAYPDLSPGPLTRLRGANVDNEKLARVAVATGLHLFIRHKAPHLERQIEEFMTSMLEYPVHSNGLLDPPKVLADIVESLLGAIFMDSDSSLDIVWKVFKRLAEPLISPETLGKHPVSELYELCQKKGMRLKFIKDTWTENTTVVVVINDSVVGSAAYGNKKEIAQNRAAKDALDRLKEALRDSDTTFVD